MQRSGILILFLFLVGLSPLIAQNSGMRPGGAQMASDGQISGKIMEKDSTDPIVSASVSVWSAKDSSLVTGAMSSPDGTFSIRGLRNGEYYVNISYVGYQTQSSNVTLAPSTLVIDLGNITLEIDRAFLTEVEVNATREFMEVQIDKTVFNTENQTVTAGGSVNDLLQTVPSVDVDTDGNVSLRGSQNVVIQMNGRTVPVTGTMLAALLSQLPADAISKIEVMPNPSARYDPDGMSGIINIVTKQGRDLGINGSVSVGYGTTDRYNGSAFVSYQKGKWNLSANYGLNRNARGGKSDGVNTRQNFYADPVTIFSQISTGERNSISNLLTANADYRLNPLNTISLAATVSINTNDSDNLNETINTDALDVVLDRYDRIAVGNGDGSNMDFAAIYDRKFTTDNKSFRVETSYNRSLNDYANIYEQQYYNLLNGDPFTNPEIQQDITDAAFVTGNAQVDYVNPLGEKTKLELGAKSTIREIDQDFASEDFDYSSQNFLTNTNLSNQFGYQEQVHAGYAQLGQNFGAINALIGIRAEQVFTQFDLINTNEQFENDYFSLYPGAFLSYNFTEQQQLKASYSKRVNRPRTQVLNPFTSYDDPLNLRTGNPYLKPEYTHAFELSYSQFSRKGMFTASPFFRRTTDAIERFKTLDTTTGVSTQTYENFREKESWGVSLSANYRPSKITNIFLSFDGAREVTDAGNVNATWSDNAFSWGIRSNVTVNLTPNLDLQAFWMYRAPREFALGRISAFQMANVSLRQKLWGDKGSLSLRLQDPLDQMGFNFELAEEAYSQISRRKWESRVAWVTFQYNFGDGKRSFEQRRRENGGNEMGGGDVGIE